MGRTRRHQIGGCGGGESAGTEHPNQVRLSFRACARVRTVIHVKPWLTFSLYQCSLNGSERICVDLVELEGKLREPE